MWTERPKARDGVLASTAIGLGLCAIVSLGAADTAKTVPEVQCQEVVVIAEQKGNILAQCPPKTYIDIVDNNVVCRCGNRREPAIIEVPRRPQWFFPYHTPNPEPPPKFDDKRGIVL